MKNNIILDSLIILTLFLGNLIFTNYINYFILIYLSIILYNIYLFYLLIKYHLKEKYDEEKVIQIASYGSLRRCFDALSVAADYLNYSEDDIKPIFEIIRKNYYTF